MPVVLAHAHSNWSYDSRLSLQDWCALAAKHGCDTVLLAEHEETGFTAARYAAFVAACQQASTADVQLVPGVEFNQGGYHVLCYGLREWPARPCDPHALADAVHQQGAFLCLAHPPRYRWRYPAALLSVVDAVEVWNSSWVCDGRLGPHPRSLALARGKTILVGQDVHKVKHVSGLIMKTPSRDVLTDLRNERFVVSVDHRLWTPQQLRRRVLAGVVQRGRTRVVRAGLSAYRFARRQVRQLLRRQLQTGRPLSRSSTS
jgi:hypothetical protein